MKKITKILMVLAIAAFSWQGYSQANCATPLALTPGTAQAGDTTGQPGDFPALANPCDVNYEDDEYWFEYTATADGETLDLTMSGITDSWAGLFVLDNCADSSPNCVAQGKNTSGTADISFVTPALTMGTSYKIVISSYGTPDNTAFTLSSTVIAPPACPDVANLSTATQADGSVNLDWDDAATATQYLYEVQPQGTAQGDAAALVSSTSTTSDAIVANTVLTSGTTYTLYVTSDCGGGALGDYQSIDFSYFLIPANDECGGAIGLTVNTGYDCTAVTAGTTAGSTASSQPDDATGTPNNDVWFTFVATNEANRVSLINVVNQGGGTSTSTDMGMSVFDDAAGCNMVAANEVGESDPDTLDLSGLTIGNTYYVRVYGWFATIQNNNFDICIGTPPTVAPDCASNFSPVDTATDVSSSITFTWDAPTTGGSATSYDVFFGEDSAALPNIGNVTGTASTITGLNLGTLYYWQIVPKNDIGDATGCVINSFTTKSAPAGPAGVTCGAGDQGTSQYTDAMDAMGGWTGDFNAVSNGTTGMWFLGQTGATVSTSTGPTDAQDAGGGYMYYESGTSTNTASAVSPLIDLNAIDAGDGAELSFYMHAYGADMGTLNVGAATTAAGPFTNIFTWDGQIQPNSADAWLQVGADVTAFTGGDLYLEFSHTGTGSFNGDMSIDTLEVIACDAIPSCQIPDMLDVTAISAGDATISWNDPTDPDVNAYEYEVTEVATSTITTGTAATPTAMLTGLTVDGDYTYRVRTDCSSGFTTLFSNWSAPFAWTQTEVPGCASNPSPADMDATTPIGTVTFTWDAPITGGTVAEYDVYAGDSAALEFGVIATVTTNTVDLNVNAPETTLFWSIVPKNVAGEASGCPVWSFTTVAADPSGADCASAEPVVDGTYTVFIDDVTAGTNNGDSVWFVYTATELGTINVNSCSGGLDTRLFIYDSCSDFIGHNDAGNVSLADSDDATTCPVNTDGSGSNFASRVDALDVVPGEDYYIQFDDRWSTGVFTFNINLTPECADSTTWDGAGWSNLAPDATKTAIIDGAYATSMADIDACAIVITATGSLTVSAGTFARANGTIINDGTLTVEPTGNVLQVDDTASMTNNGTMSVMTESPSLDSRDFQILGSPVDGETREDVWATGFNVQDYTPGNFVPNALVTATYNFADDNLDDWNELVAGALTPGAGFLVFSQDSYNGAGGVFTYDYNTGNLNNGVITQPLNFNNTQVDSPNMLSNPYASGLDATLFMAANAEIDAVYFWEHGDAPMTGVPGPNGTGPNYNNDDVSVFNAMGGTAAASGEGVAPTGVIATSQGFGVFASAAGTAVFNNSMRSTTGNTTLRNTEDDNRVWLHIENTEFNLGGYTLVGFTDAATAGYDRQFDNFKLGTAVSIFSHIDSDLETGYSIQGRESFNVDMRVPVGFSSQIDATSSYKVSLSDFDGTIMENTDVYLVDNVVGTITNLSKENYAFTSAMGTFNNRFTLQFVDRGVLGTTDADLTAVTLSPNPTSGLVNIVSPRALVNNISITDIQGRVVNTISVDGLNSYQLDMSSLRSAVYFVQVTTEAGTITKRLIKK